MPITITTETNVAVAPGVNTEVVDTLSGRKGLTLQLQAEGDVWIKLGGAASVNDGVRVGGWERIVIDSSFNSTGNSADFYEGAVNVFWEGGGVDPATNDHLTTANVRVIEAS